MTSLFAVMNMARRGELSAVLGKVGVSGDIINNILMPYCRWPVSAKRAWHDDFQDPECVDDRADLDYWHLLTRPTESSPLTFLATFHGFFNSLEICTHLATAQTLATSKSTKPCRLIAPADVDVAVKVLESLPKLRDDVAAGHNDFVRSLLDRFSISSSYKSHSHCLIRQSDYTCLADFDASFGSGGNEILLTVETVDPSYTIHHPDLNLDQPIKRICS